MRTWSFPFADVNRDSFALKVANGNVDYRNFFEYQPNLQGIYDAKEKKRFPSHHRKTLVEALKGQYEQWEIPVPANVSRLLQENTFTVTTGHQLNFLSGPHFFFTKIASTIHLSRLVGSDCIPVFWMASEDHDFEEIKSVSLYGKTISWETQQQGAVGRMNLSGLSETIQHFKQFFTNHQESELFGLIEQLYGSTYGEAFFRFVHAMFADFGLVIIDGDQKDFKRAFSGTMKKEIESQFSYKAVNKTNELLSERNFKIQVNPREINLFYLSENKRERILADGHDFRLGTINVSKNDLLDLIDESPESFSPNVILRPIYQELLLPNLCYVGGVGELSYWLQLKAVFENVGICYPLIQARTSALWIDSVSKQKLEKFNIQITDLFKPIHELKKQILVSIESENIDFELIDFQYNQFKTDFLNKANQIDSSLNSRMGAEFAKIGSQLENLKAQLTRSIKTKHEHSLLGIEQLKNKLFPNDSLQERTVNFFQFCSDGNYSTNLSEIISLIQPFDSDFLVFEN
jgi:bacillithiol biosynthesis cysteine-adding enzyme BshC